MGHDRRLGLVLGGGGVAGVAWHTGRAVGLSEGGMDLSVADHLVGTSAGSTIAAQIAGGLTLTELFDRQVDPRRSPTSSDRGLSIAELWERMAPIYAESADGAERRRRLGPLSRPTRSTEAVRRRVIAPDSRDSAGWTTGCGGGGRGDHRRTAGVRRGSSGVDLVDAVAASCAVPGIWPPVTIGGARYIDGGIWSLTNSTWRRVRTGPGARPLADATLPVELAGLGAGGCQPSSPRRRLARRLRHRCARPGSSRGRRPGPDRPGPCRGGDRLAALLAG